LSAELTSVVLLGIGCAANPWGIMIAVLLLDARRGHGIVWAYVVAWIGAITVVLTALLAGFGAIFESGSDSANTAAAAVELILGLALLGWGLQRLLAARRASTSARPAHPSAPVQLPSWLRAIESISYVAAFLLGIYSATYPLVIAAGGEILRADGNTAETTALAVLFIVLGSSSVVAVAALGTFAPRRSAPLLERMRAWLTVHNRAVITAILLVLGVSLTARGLTGLG
jgi:Sap, sulfolipid-1-addressing protein